MMDVTVLGAGVVGMTSAYALARKGYRVTVIDAANCAGEGGASFGNGAQLSYSYTDALASPSVVAHLPKYILGLDPAFRLIPTSSPSFWAWTFAFLANCSKARFEDNTITLLKLALESRGEFSELANQLSFDHGKTGKLNLFSTHQAMAQAETLSRLKNKYGVAQVMLKPEEAVEMEPALSAYGYSFVGALWSPYDEVGDSRKFCRNLQRLLQDEYGVTFRFSTNVTGLNERAGKLKAIHTDVGDITCSRAVIALGITSKDIARTVGIRLPIWPMQGYSMTIPAKHLAPKTSITDTMRKIVFCRIGDHLRIAGLADIGGDVRSFKQERFTAFLNAARSIFPEAGDYTGNLHAWTGFRPMTPNSRPIVGRTHIEGIYLNCGHGSLGWTLSMGTARLLSALL